MIPRFDLLPRVLLLGGLGALLAGAPARAASNTDAHISIHLLTPTTKNACARSAALTACTNLVTSGRLESGYFAYLLATNVVYTAGLGGLQCGIQYDGAPGQGVDVFSWTNCATLEFSSTAWPAAGGGNLITWDTATRCQRTEPGGPGTGVVAIAGYFYVSAYTADRMAVTVRPVDGYAKVADCQSNESLLEGGGVHHDPSTLGYASFSADGSVPGYNPCVAPPPIDCAISGPGSAFQGQPGLVYSAPNAPAGATYHWSVSGGSIPGSSSDPTVSITAGSGGAMTVSVDVVTPGGSSSCQKGVGLTAPTCSITGQDPAYAGIPEGYGPVTNLPSPTYHWTVTGNATWSGVVGLGGSIVVDVGTVGAFDLGLVITSPAGTVSCQRTITVVPEPAPSCTINGPSAVTEGAAGSSYTLNWGSGALLDVAWSITGNGTITSPLTNSAVQVTAGDIGAFELTAVFHSDASQLAGTCTKTVTVNPLTCAIGGQGTVPAFAVGVGYSAGATLAGATYAWTISGNGTIVSGGTSSAVIVNVGAVGAFDLGLDITRAGVTHHCTRTITVQAAGSCGSANASAKILVHLLPVTTKNACGSRSRPACNLMLTSGTLYPTLYYAYLTIIDANAVVGVGGAELGITYNGATHAGVDVFNWVSCGSAEAPSNGWPAPGGGNRIGWDGTTSCQRTEPAGAGTGVSAGLGYFYLSAYSPDVLQVTANPASGKAKVLDCTYCETLVGGVGFPINVASHLGTVNFGGGNGYNPCGGVYPVQSTSWGSIKALYGPGGAAATSTRRSDGGAERP